MPLAAVADRLVDCPTSKLILVAEGVETVGSAETVSVTAVLMRPTPLLSVTVTVVANVPLPTDAGVQVSKAVLAVAHPAGSVPHV